MEQAEDPFWSQSADQAFRDLQSSREGLPSVEARRRLAPASKRRLKPRDPSQVALLVAQFKSPICVLLIAAVILSLALRDHVDAVLILAILGISGLLGFWQERGAVRAVANLRNMVRTRATVLRDGRETKILADDSVPGDVVLLSAGATVAGDCLLLEARDLFVNESALTGETYPVEKRPGLVPGEAPPALRTNALFLGTHVVSGEGRAIVVLVGRDTQFGQIAERLRLRQPETDFEHGVRRFGYFLIEVTLVLVIAIFAVNVYLHRPVLESFLFSLALAVGLTPQLLPAIIAVNLAHGARRMAARDVIVRRLSSIENFGSMDVLCSDKTGTLTEGVVRIQSAVDCSGNRSETVLLHATLNASFETGFSNPIDEAIRAQSSFDLTAYSKLDEIP